MAVYDKFPAVDETNNFPPEVKTAIAQSYEMTSKYAHLSDGNLVIGGVPVGGGGGGGGVSGDFASLNTVGIGRAVFIESGGTIPTNTPDYTIVIEFTAG